MNCEQIGRLGRFPASTALHALVFRFAHILASSVAWASTLFRRLVASLAVFLALSAPLPSAAISVCLPLPTPNGIAKVCLDVGASAEKPSKESNKVNVPEPVEVPQHVNAHRTPIWSEGTILSRAGIRPFSMLSDAQAKIKAVAIQRLEIIKTTESLTSSSSPPPSSSPENPQLSGPARRKALLDKGIDGVALRYGNADMPRSLIVADWIDPVLVSSWSVLAAVLFRKQLARLLRRILLPHHRAHHIVVLKVQVAVGGACAPHLSLTCRTLARMIHEGIISLYMCPHTAIYVSSHCCTSSVLILLHI